MSNVLKVKKEVNPHFEDFLFDWKHKFYWLFGGYGSSKSYHVALKIVLKLLQEKRKALVVRDVYDTIRDSCYALFADIICELELDDKVTMIASPMMIRFPNGSRIIFKGLDKPRKLKSIHDISIVWIEECNEIKYEGFKELIGRLRHPTLDLFMILSCNPVGRSSWTYVHFIKRLGILELELYEKRIVVAGGVYYHHSTADDNLFLPASYIEELDKIATYDIDLYRIARKGMFGTSGIIVLPQFTVVEHDLVMAAVNKIPDRFKRTGMDFGFVKSSNAVLRIAIDDVRKWLYIYWEYYKNKTTDDVTAVDLVEFKHSKEKIYADAAEPKTIAYFRKQGLNIVGSKGDFLRIENIKKVKRFRKIICSDECKNTIFELKELTFATDRDGEVIEDEFNIDPHTLSAIWYSLAGYHVADVKGGYGGYGIKQGRV